MNIKMHDLGQKPAQPMADSEERKYYPSARVPLAAIKGAPTDGKEFTVTMKCCVRSVDNKDEAADLEFKGLTLGQGSHAKGSDDSGDTESRVPRRTFKESVEKAKSEAGKDGY